MIFQPDMFCSRGSLWAEGDDRAVLQGLEMRRGKDLGISSAGKAPQDWMLWLVLVRFFLLSCSLWCP